MTPDFPVSPPRFEGVLTANPKGFAFVHLGDGKPDVFIPPRARMSAQQGEIVKVEIDEETTERRTGRVVELPSRSPEWVGEVIEEEGFRRLKPVDARHPLVNLLASDEAAVGDMVLARLTNRPAHPVLGQATWVRTLGSGPTAAVINEIVALGHRLPSEFSDEVMAAATGLSVSDDGRTDLRHIPFITIDAISSRDLDDALWAQSLPDGATRLCVAIADVAFFVRPGSVIDEEARRRTTSVYLPGRVLPMLPHELSQDLCSLNPGVDRMCVVCDMVVSIDGEVSESKFYRATMRSAARLTYDQVETHLFGDTAMPLTWSPIASSLQALRRVYESLLTARQARGAIDFESAEATIKINATGQTLSFERTKRGHSHRLVEETMVAANVQAARTLDERAHLGLFRSHSAPPPKKRETLDALLNSRNIPLPEATPGALAELARAYPALSSAILRAQDKASYQINNGGHFGLGLAHYAHFTSPIRRYPDLVIHRVLLGEAQPDLEALAAMCSEGERRATLAERESVDRLRCAFLSANVGKRFSGHIDSITRMGIFVSLDESRASGLLPLSCFGENAIIDAVAQTLVDQAGDVWSLGYPIEVALASADWKTNRLEFAAPLPAPEPTHARGLKQ